MRIIDADALMERLKAWDTNDAIDKALYNFALNRVLEAPTVEPERKTGRWHVLDECSNAAVYCSNCHKKVFKLDFSNTMKWKSFKFCPNCGSHNGGEKEIKNVKA